MNVIKKGSRGADVVTWQKFLGLAADGVFGDDTERATKVKQTAAGLVSDGVVGQKSWALTGAPVNHDKTFLISAGHTNNPKDDRGAVGNGYIEGVESVRVRDAVAAKLRAFGLNVIEDGADGINDPLRKALALAESADVAVEFHFNAGPAAASGVEVLAKPKLKTLSQNLARAISNVLGNAMRGSDGGWKADNSGQHHRLGFCEAGGVIVEIGFISNAQDMASYKQNFDRMTTAIADVLKNV